MDEVTKAELERVHDQVNRLDKRLEKVENLYETIQQLTLSIQKVNMTTTHMSETVSSIDQRLKDLEAEPGEKWVSMRKTIYAAAFSALGGAIAMAIVSTMLNYIK